MRSALNPFPSIKIRLQKKWDWSNLLPVAHVLLTCNRTEYIAQPPLDLVLNQISIIDLRGKLVLFIDHTAQPHHRDHLVTEISSPWSSNTSIILLAHYPLDQTENKSQSSIYWVQISTYHVIETIGYRATGLHKHRVQTSLTQQSSNQFFIRSQP